MKIGVIVSGEPRYSDLSGKLFRANTSVHTYDIFIHSWDHAIFGLSLDFTNWDPKMSRIHLQSRMMDPILDRVKGSRFLDSDPVLRRKRFYEYFGHMLSTYYAVDMCKDRLLDYDIILKIRHDSFLDNIDKNVDKLARFMELALETPYPTIDQGHSIFVETTNFMFGVPVIQDFTFFGYPEAFLAFNKDLPEAIVKLCSTKTNNNMIGPHINRKFFFHHRIWTLMFELKEINVIPFKVGCAPLYHSPDFRSILLRPGVENCQTYDYQTLSQIYLNYGMKPLKHRLDDA